MATLPTTPTYTTIAEFQANTRVASQATIVEASWKPYALDAEYIIDAYVGRVEPYDSDQVRKFPTVDEDGASHMPIDVKKAHIEITSWLISKGEPTTNNRSAKSESWSNTAYSVTYMDLEESINMGLPSFVLRLLRPWRVDVGPLTY